MQEDVRPRQPRPHRGPEVCRQRLPCCEEQWPELQGQAQGDFINILCSFISIDRTLCWTGSMSYLSLTSACLTHTASSPTSASLWALRSRSFRQVTSLYIRLNVCESVFPSALVTGTNSEIEGLTFAKSGTNFFSIWD